MSKSNAMDLRKAIDITPSAVKEYDAIMRFGLRISMHFLF